MWAPRIKVLRMRELSKTAASGDIDKTVIIRQASNDRQKMKLMILIKGGRKIMLIKRLCSMKVNRTFHSVDINLLRHNHFRIDSAYTHIFRPLALLTTSYFTLEFQCTYTKLNNSRRSESLRHTPCSKRLFTFNSFGQLFLEMFRHFQWHFFGAKIGSKKLGTISSPSLAKFMLENRCTYSLISASAFQTPYP